MSGSSSRSDEQRTADVPILQPPSSQFFFRCVCQTAYPEKFFLHKRWACEPCPDRVPDRMNSEQRPSLSCSRLPHSFFFDVFVKLLTLKNSFYINAGRVNHVRIEFPGLNQMLDFGDRNFRRSRHHGIEVARGFAIDEMAVGFTSPRLQEREVGFERAFNDAGTAFEFAGLFAIGNYRAAAGRSEESG